MSPMGIDDDLRVLAERQHGALSRVQARGLEVSPSGLRSRLAGPDWVAPTPRALRLAGAPRTDHQELMLAVLDAGPGAVVGHRAAAALWHLPGFAFGPIELVRQRGWSGRRSAMGRIRECRLLPRTHCTERDAIPVTSLARTLFDIAADVHALRLARLVDTVVSRTPGMLPSLHAMLDELGERGRNGVAAMRAVLEERPTGYLAPASGLEARFIRILAEAGEAPLERHVDLGGHEWIGRVDFVDRHARVVVEIDSATHHSSKVDRERDRQRDQALLAAGWRAVVRIAEDVVWHRPAEAVAGVRRARRAAG